MRYIISLILIVVILTSCKKYPEGPFISFRSRDTRVVNSWGVEKALVNNVENTPIYSKYTYDFNQDATYSEFNGFLPLTGNWAFTDDEDSIIVKYNNNTQILHRFKILKLKNSSIWLLETRNSSSYEWHLKTN